MADEFDLVSMVQEVLYIEANDKSGHNICDYLLCTGTDLETWPEIVSIPHHKVSNVVLISLINKTKQKLNLSEFTKLVQGHTDSKLQR